MVEGPRLLDEGGGGLGYVDAFFFGGYGREESRGG